MLDIESVGGRFGLGEGWVWKQVREGLLPKPVKLGRAVSRWPVHEIDALLAARVAGMGEQELRALVINLMTARCGAGVALA